MKFSIYLSAREILIVVNKLTARSKDLISSYINLNAGVVGSLFVMRGKQKRPMLTATTLPTRSRD